MNYGQKLKSFLKQNRITIGELSEKTNIRRDTIKNLLYGKTSKLEYIEAIARAYNQPLDYFTDTVPNYLETEKFCKACTVISELLKEYKILKCQESFLNGLIRQSYKDLNDDQHDEIQCKINLIETISQGIKNGLVER